MMNPFDFKAALLAKHAQHVVLIHFPIALFIAGAVFDFLAHYTKLSKLAVAAYCNFLVAAITTVPVLVTGLLAWQWQLEGQRLKGALLLHLGFGFGSSVLIWLVCLVHRRAQRNQDAFLPAYRLPLEALTAILVALTGHLGGFLSGVNIPS
jgi:uncharacterized membrane protein